MIDRCDQCGDWRFDGMCRTCLIGALNLAARIKRNLAAMAAINERHAA